jgi:hypothetical protein
MTSVPVEDPRTDPRGRGGEDKSQAFAGEWPKDYTGVTLGSVEDVLACCLVVHFQQFASRIRN